MAQKGSGDFIPEDMQIVTGCGPRQPALRDPALMDQLDSLRGTSHLNAVALVVNEQLQIKKTEIKEKKPKIKKTPKHKRED